MITVFTNICILYDLCELRMYIEKENSQIALFNENIHESNLSNGLRDTNKNGNTMFELALAQ